MMDEAEDLWPGRAPSVFARLVAPLLVIGCVVLGVAVVVITYRPPPTLTAAELHETFANQRLEFWQFEKLWWARSNELLDGDEADIWVDTAPPHDSGDWWIDDDTVCFKASWGTGCWRVAIGPANRVYWYDLDGDYASTVTMRRVEDEEP